MVQRNVIVTPNPILKIDGEKVYFLYSGGGQNTKGKIPMMRVTINSNIPLMANLGLSGSPSPYQYDKISDAISKSLESQLDQFFPLAYCITDRLKTNRIKREKERQGGRKNER